MRVLHIVNLLDILKLKILPSTIDRKKEKRLFIDEFLTNLQWQELQQNKKKEKLCTTVQPAEAGTNPRSCKPLPRKIPYVWDAGKPSEPVATCLHIDSQGDTKILSSKLSHYVKKKQYNWFGSEVRKSTCR